MTDSITDMKTIGLIGGTSWHSTIDYYRYINQMVNDSFGNNTNPPLVMYNLNQQKVFELQKANDWDGIAAMLIGATKQLENAGAESVLFCANTPHKVYDMVVKGSNIPIIHIADKTGVAIKQKQLKKVGLIGTKYTMEGDFIKKRIAENYQVDVIVPNAAAQSKLHEIIQKELTVGIFKDSTKQYVLSQIKMLQDQGAEGIILGCTEFPLIIKEEDLTIPSFNTTLLHAEAAVDFILSKE
ncbi:aspartate/glutamate racemase family protein [Leptobacterium sp. I13]|uniref:aspartate/glutamate racemase family protein n=1 Tax=Leptobacterium meishanense TaxID=3128904 RepID=UPI0030EF2C5D